jgi:hypothetical protein
MHRQYFDHVVGKKAKGGWIILHDVKTCGEYSSALYKYRSVLLLAARIKGYTQTKADKAQVTS